MRGCASGLVLLSMADVGPSKTQISLCTISYSVCFFSTLDVVDLGAAQSSRTTEQGRTLGYRLVVCF